MSTESRTTEDKGLSTTDSSSAQFADRQGVGRELFYHRYLYRPYTTSSSASQIVSEACDLFGHSSRISGFANLFTSGMTHHIGTSVESFSRSELDDAFKYIARRISRLVDDPDTDAYSLEVDDYREAELQMDWQRAEELCRKMMEE